jgi:hypothetical protein
MKGVKVELEAIGAAQAPALYMERQTGGPWSGKRHVLTLALTPEQARQVRLFLEQ